jgi:hopanoid-associated phosphorylase
MDAPAGVLVVSGLRREAAIFVKSGIPAICGDAATLRGQLARLARSPPRVIMSAGICGGLDPSLRRGTIVLGTEVVAGTERIEADAGIVQKLARLLSQAGKPIAVGRVAAVDAPALTAEAKAALRAGTGAVAVDMESLIAGRFAMAHGLPFAILRTVSDTADRDLPPLALEAVSADGRVNVAAVIAALIRRPDQLLPLVAAARDSAAALRALRRLPGLLSSLGGPDF